MNHVAKTLNELSFQIYEDAEKHKLYDEYRKSFMNGNITQTRMRFATRIALECYEAFEAADDERHFAEEIADVIIMALSASRYLFINIGDQVVKKMMYNSIRPIKHEGENENGKV